MKLHLVVCFAGVVLLSACEPKTPEHPANPPTPNAASAAAAETDVEKPTLTSRLNSGGRNATYAAYFADQTLERIEERLDGDGPSAEYEYRGARLHKYSQPAHQAGGTILELDDQGRIEQATAAGRELAQAEIDSIRTRAQLLRSHALAQRASKLHAQ